MGMGGAGRIKVESEGNRDTVTVRHGEGKVSRQRTQDELAPET